MEFTVKLPVFFKAQPPRTKGLKDIAVHETRKVDIREVSALDMLPAMQTAEAYSFNNGFDLSDATLKPHRQTVRSLNGHLYRKVASLADVERLRLFDRPYPRNFRQYGGFRSAISFIEARNPIEDQAASESLTAPLFHQQSWQMQCAELRNQRLDNFWPTDFPQAEPNERGNNGEWWKRNHFSLETILPRIREYDAQGLEKSREMADRLMDGFVVVGNDLWERCGSPAYRVEYSSGQHALATITLVHAPLWNDRRIDIQYFPVSDKDAAVQYAESLLKAMHDNLEHRYLSYRVLDRTVPFEINDSLALNLDRGAEEMFRMSCALAAENRRFLTRNPDKQARFGQEAVEGVFSAYDEMEKTNYILGEYGNPDEWIEANADIWVSCGRHQGYYIFGQKHINNLLLSRAKSLYEDRPIAFTPISSAGLGL